MAEVVVADLEKRYAGAVALAGVSFRARPGEVLGFLGPNGAGKTTTLRIVAGFLAPTAGTVTVGGADVVREPRAVQAQLGYLPESVPLYAEMRVREYLTYRAALKGVPSPLRRARVEEAAARVGLADALGRVIGQLSRGYRQRVGLADALTHQPPVLILDEPTEGLDPNQRREVLDTVRALGRERTVILSTHVLPEAETLCDRLVIIDRGRVVASGTPAELLAGAAPRRVRIEVRGDIDAIVKALQELPGVIDVVREEPIGEDIAAFMLSAETADKNTNDDIREMAARAVIDAGGGLRDLRALGGTLDAVFARLTGKSDGAKKGGV